MTEPKTETLHVPGAVLHYDIRSADSSTHPVLLIIGSPMGADGFVTLAGHFADRTVVTYDPRGSGRSQRTDGALISSSHHQHDFDALRAASTRVIVAVGEESRQMVAGRAGVAVAERLGTTPVTFPGGHDGFLGGEYGSTGKPDAFAAAVRAVLSDASPTGRG